MENVEDLNENKEHNKKEKYNDTEISFFPINHPQNQDYLHEKSKSLVIPELPDWKIKLPLF